MQCSGCGEKIDGPSAAPDCCTGCAGAQATLTLWKEGLPKGATAEESIRGPVPDLASFGRATLHARRLADARSAAGDRVPDFELMEELGSGGMGVVYNARQTSLDRPVAIKMARSGRPGGTAAPSDEALAAEAVVTGRLEHPNVVPVYDLGVDGEGRLFYAMKEVQGRPWVARIRDKTLDENLDILMRVADTVSFAHSRGILHRDLKPHNVMLGEFGETMVMDWGAACALPEAANPPGGAAPPGLAGTPAYMPPEMARGDANRLGKASDVYLLGAILYHLVAGHPPRTEKDPALCLAQAAENHIQPAEGNRELLRIALKAMSSSPADRYRDVKDFQRAVREYRDHSESLVLLESARKNLAQAAAEGDYGLFGRAIYGLEEALALWTGNLEAAALLDRARLGYARCAMNRKDYELALSVLDPACPAHADAAALIRSAIADRDAHRRMVRRWKWTARGLGTAVLLVFVVAFFWIRREQRNTALQHRRSLVNLVSARYGEMNYPATLDAFWQMHERYGSGAFGEGTLLDVRVAAAMNPHRGTVRTGLHDALGLVAGIDPRHLWVVGKNRVCKVALADQPGREEGEAVSVHDHAFAKRSAPGAVAEAFDLPGAAASARAFHEAADGTVWAGSGSWLYRREGGTWRPVLDVAQLEYPPLPERYNIDRPALEQWMAETGSKLPITGILPNRDQTRAAIAMGPDVVCWIDLQEKTCLGWLAVGHGTRFGGRMVAEDHPDGEVFLALSGDEKRLAYRSAVPEQSMVFSFRLPDMYREAYAYSRDYPVRAVSTAGCALFHALSSRGRLFAPDESILEKFAVFYMGGDDENRVRWGPEYSQVREFPHSDIRRAAFSPDGRHCAFLTEDGLLCLAGGGGAPLFEIKRRISVQQPADLLVSDDAFVALLSADGSLDAYDLRGYGVMRLPLEAHIAGIAKSWEPGGILVAEPRAGGTHEILACRIADNGAFEKRPVMTLPGHGFCADPSGKYLAVKEGRYTVSVHAWNPPREVLSVQLPRRAEVGRFRFDEAGRYLVLGGDYVKGLRVFNTADWSVAKGSDAEFTDVLFDAHPGGTALLCTSGSRKTLEGYAIGPGAGEPARAWSASVVSAPLAIVPYTDPQSGRRKYWCKFWLQDFGSFDALTGEADPARHLHWKKSGLLHPEFTAADPRVVFPRENGALEIALKTDLYPLFDPRALGVKVEQVVLAADARRLYILSGGAVYCMKLPPWKP